MVGEIEDRSTSFRYNETDFFFRKRKPKGFEDSSVERLLIIFLAESL